MATEKLEENLYYLNKISNSRGSCRALYRGVGVWHARFGHIYSDGLLNLASKYVVDGRKLESSKYTMECSSCIHGRQARTEIPKHFTSPRSPGSSSFGCWYDAYRVTWEVTIFCYFH